MGMCKAMGVCKAMGMCKAMGSFTVKILLDS